MKRVAFLLIMLVPAAVCFPVGLGVGVTGGFAVDESGTTLASAAVSSEMRVTHMPLSAACTVDVDYFMARIGYSQYLLRHELWTQTAGGTLTTLSDADTGTAGYVTFAFFARYPFPLGAVSIAPLLGAEYDANVMMLDATGTDIRGPLSDGQKAAQNRAWLKAGASLQIALSDHAYLQGDLLLGCRLPSAAERNAARAARQAGFDVTLFALQSELGIMAGIKF